MAISSPINIQNVSGSIRSLKLGLNRAKQSAGSIKTAILNRTIFKRQAIAGRKVLQNRRTENIGRRDQEDILEATGISGVFKRAGTVATESAKGFLGRILDFITTMLVGWLLYNLPTILAMVRDLIKRVQTLFSLLQGFISNVGKVFGNLGNILNAVLYDVTHLDFLDSQKKVQNAMKDFESTFGDFHNQFDEGFKLFTTPLGEGIGEEPVPATGTDYTKGGVITGSEQQKVEKLLGSYEGSKLKAYKDSEGIWTIGEGNTSINGRPVREGDTITAEQSIKMKRDAIDEHRQRAIKQVGLDNWNRLPENTRVALTSVVYNYGSIPTRILSAVKSGNSEKIAEGIVGLSGDNRGVNAWRRKDEAQVIRTGISSRVNLPKGNQVSPQLAQASTISQQYSSQGSGGRSSAASLAEAAKSLKGMSSASGPGGGRIACVWAVNRVFAQARIRPPWGASEYVPTAEAMMIKEGYQKIPNGQQRPGDLYICNNQNHIGIVLPNGNIISNSSSGAKFSWEASLQSYESEFKGPGKFYRLPGSTVSSPGLNTPGQLNNAANSISATISSPSNSQADQRIVQQRRGQQIVYIDDRQPTPPPIRSGGGGGQSSSQSVPEDGLNSLIKMQMLLDLAYT
jgi:GH24 family phage-related lysozyme (muramidase)